MKESTQNTMKESLRNIRQIISRSTWLRSILVVLGVMISVSGWGWTSWVDLAENPAWTPWATNEIQSNSQYYLYNERSGLFLNANDNNLSAVSSEPTTLWTFTLSGDKCEIQNENDYIWIDVSQQSGFYKNSTAHSKGDASSNSIGASHSLSFNNDENNRYRFYHNRRINSINYGAGFLAVDNNQLSTIGGGWGNDPLNYPTWRGGDAGNAKNYWYAITPSQYASKQSQKEGQYYIYNVGTGQFLSLHKEGDNVKSYTTNNPSNASLFTIQLKHIAEGTKLSFLKTNVEDIEYYLYNNNGSNEEYKNNDFYFEIHPKTIKDTAGYQLVTSTDHVRYACAGYGNYTSDGKYCELTFPQDDNVKEDEDLNSLWLFISVENYDNAIKEKLAPIHVPFSYNRFLYFDREISFNMIGTEKWEDTGVTEERLRMNDNTPGGTNHDNSMVIQFVGIPDKIKFRVYPNSGVGTTDFRLRESDGGEIWSDDILKKTSQNPEDKELDLKPTSRFIKLEYYGRGYGYYENIQITELLKFDVSDDDIPFGDVSVNEGYPIQTITLDYANAGINTHYIKASSSNPESFVVSPAQIECGRDEMGTQQYVITFVGKTEGSHSADITITDDDGNSKVVHVDGTRVLKKDPIFIWNQLNIPYYQGTTINDFVVSSNPKGEITYSCSPANAGVSIDDNGTLTIDNTASTSIKITATQEGDNEWNNHKENHIINPINFGVSKVPRVPFYLTEAIYNNRNTETCAQDVGTDNVWSDLGGDSDPYVGVRLGRDVDFGSVWQWVPKAIVLQFEGIPDCVYFRIRTNASIATGEHWYVYEKSSKDEEWSVAWKSGKDGSTYEAFAVPLKHSTRFVKLYYDGNFAGYYKDIHISAYDGYGYLKKKDGEDFKYLSRGGNDGTNIISDEFGLAVRRVRDVLSAGGSEITRAIFLDNKEIINPSTIANYPIFEKAKTYERELQEKKDKQAVEAASEFGIDVPTEAILREVLAMEDYASEVLSVSDKPSPGERFIGNNRESERVWQHTINGLQPGLYKITLKAFHRMCDKESAYEYHNNEEGHYDNSVAYFMVEYGNKLDDSYKCYKTPITTLFEVYNNKRYITSDNANYGMVDYEPISGHYYPDCAKSAKVALSFADRYNNDIFIYVGENGNFVYSLYNPSNANHSNWLYWGDVTLTRYYRKEFVFDNGNGADDSGNEEWTKGNNWRYGESRGEVPQSMHKVRIEAPVTISNADKGAYSITYGTNGNGNITIDANASLSVREGGLSDKYISENHITLKANNSGQTGTLKLYPGTDAPQATVEMYSDIGTKEGLKNDRNSEAPWYWQYIGSPVTEQSLRNQNLFNERIFYLCWLFEHDTETNNWTNAGNWKYMEEFKGYAFTRDERSTGPLFGFSGTLNAAPKEPKEINLTYNETHCENFIANSWTAPIQIKNFIREDFDNDKVSPYIYIYKKEYRGNVESIAINTAEYTGNDVIPAMQGFSVKANAAGAKLLLDYNRLVWESEEKQNGALKAPSRVSGNHEVDLSRRICVNMMSADSIADRVYLIEKEAEGFSPAFTEGYDAPKHEVTGLPCIYTYEPDGQHLNVSATDDLMGSYLALNTDSSSTYTISFSMVIGEGLGLRDLVADTILPIVNGGQYVFTAMPNSTNQLRFVVEEYVAPDNGNMGGTDIIAADNGKISIVQQDEIVYITGAARNSSVEMYDAAGRSVLKKSFHYAATIDISALPAGIYVATVDKKATIKVLR